MEQLVLEELRQLLRYIPKHEKHRRRITELDTLIERLYVDNVSVKITDERYEKNVREV